MYEIKVNLKQSEIISANRVGKPVANISGSEEDRRSILFKLAEYEEKVDILAACKTVKPSGLFVNESVIPKRSNILYCLRQAKKKFPNKVAACRTMDMKVFVWVKPPNPNAPGARNSRMQINTPTKLNEFCINVLKTPLSSIVRDVGKLSSF